MFTVHDDNHNSCCCCRWWRSWAKLRSGLAIHSEIVS